MSEEAVKVDEQQDGGENKETKKEKVGKIKTAFNNNLKNIGAIIGKEPDKKRRRKVPEGSLDSIVSELFKEEDEALVKEFKVELKQLLESYVKLNEELEKKRKEL